MPSKARDLVGQRFGRLVVLSRAANDRWGPRWDCRCDCGQPHNVPSLSLVHGRTTSCGCRKAENLAALPTLATKHGHNRRGHYSPTYFAWASMLQRCHNPKHPYFAYYGGRGITVCAEWRKGFEAFLRDMGPRPPGLTLERKDNALGYSAENCRWATRREQSANTRRVVEVHFDGEKMCLKEFARRLGISSTSNYGSLRRFIRLGHTPVMAATKILERARRIRAIR